jgi:amidohydrolase
LILAILGLLAAAPVSGSGLSDEIDERAAAVAPRVLGWRRDIHQHPELSNRERRTADLVASELRRLGLEVRTGVAHTGVVGVLRGAAPGPVVALRADMDALPVTEEVDLPFASKVRTEFAGQEVGVMHACGHDTHTAMLLGAAGILAGVREQLPGTVVFLFQPAEERPPPGEDGGAKLMIAEGALADPAPEAIFALHAVTQHPVGTVAYRSGGAMASSDRMAITVRGQGTHAAYPWRGVDPIAAASRLVLALQAIPGRQLDARLPAVVSIGAIHGGVRHNVIPDAVELQGTVRSLDPQERHELHRRIEREAEGIARATGTEIELTIDVENGYPVTVNDPTLTRRMLPTIARVAPRTVEALPRTGAEDFAFYAERVPGLYLWLGIRPPDVAAEDAAPNHSSRFFVDERALPLGTRLLAHLAVDYLSEPRTATPVR